MKLMLNKNKMEFCCAVPLCRVRRWSTHQETGISEFPSFSICIGRGQSVEGQRTHKWWILLWWPLKVHSGFSSLTSAYRRWCQLAFGSILFFCTFLAQHSGTRIWVSNWGQFSQNLNSWPIFMIYRSSKYLRFTAGHWGWINYSGLCIHNSVRIAPYISPQI